MTIFEMVQSAKEDDPRQAWPIIIFAAGGGMLTVRLDRSAAKLHTLLSILFLSSQSNHTWLVVGPARDGIQKKPSPRSPSSATFDSALIMRGRKRHGLRGTAWWLHKL